MQLASRDAVRTLKSLHQANVQTMTQEVAAQKRQLASKDAEIAQLQLKARGSAS